MRLLIFFLLSLPLAAQVASQDIAVLFGGKRGLVRSGLAAGVQAGSANLVLRSQELDNAAWTVGAEVTRTADNVAAPDGTMTAEKIVCAGTVEGSNRIFQDTGTAAANGTPYVGSVWVRADSSITVILTLERAGPADGQAASLAVTTVWQRFTIAHNGVWTGTSAVRLRLHGSQVTFYAWGAQLNPGSTALPYVATTDLQSIASIPPGTATLVRGATTAASTDDPTVSLAGWTFDSGDRVSGIPAKGAAWTTTNCSGVECYTVTSTGQEYINGVARRNNFLWSAPLLAQVPTKSAGIGQATFSENGLTNGVTFPAGASTQYADLAATLVSGSTYTVSAYVVMDDASAPRPGGWAANHDFEFWIGGVWVEGAVISDSGGGLYRVAATITNTYNNAHAGIYRHANHSGKAFRVTGYMINPGSTALPYQKTTDSREWALETPGNYVGLLTGFYRWDRVLNPGEVLNNYRAWLKPRINSVGNTLP